MEYYDLVRKLAARYEGEFPESVKRSMLVPEGSCPGRGDVEPTFLSVHKPTRLRRASARHAGKSALSGGGRANQFVSGIDAKTAESILDRRGWYSARDAAAFAAAQAYAFKVDGDIANAARCRQTLELIADYTDRYWQQAQELNTVPCDLYALYPAIVGYESIKETFSVSDLERVRAMLVQAVDYRVYGRAEPYMDSWHRNIMVAAALLKAGVLFPDADHVGVWLKQAQQKWDYCVARQCTGEDSMQYNLQWLFYLCLYALAEEDVAFFGQDWVRSYFDQLLALVTPAGALPNYGESMQDANWALAVALLEKAGSLYVDGGYRWGAARLFDHYSSKMSVQHDMVWGNVWALCYADMWQDDNVAVKLPDTPPRLGQMSKTVLRTGWVADDIYVLVSTIQNQAGYGHNDNNAIVMLHVNGALLLADGTFGQSALGDHNVLAVFCGECEDIPAGLDSLPYAKSKSSRWPAQVLVSGDGTAKCTLKSRIRRYLGLPIHYTREVTICPDKPLTIIDEIEAILPGDYTMAVIYNVGAEMRRDRRDYAFGGHIVAGDGVPADLKVVYADVARAGVGQREMGQGKIHQVWGARHVRLGAGETASITSSLDCGR